MAEVITRSENGYDEIYGEVLRLIPIYSHEWTNYNNSDPGITVLQSLAQLALWQNNSIGEPNLEIAEKLLALLSLKEGKCTPAKVTVGLSGGLRLLPQGTQLFSSGSCYESCEEENLYGGGINMLCTRTAGNEITDLSYLLYSGISSFVYPFGEKPSRGMEFYIGLDNPLQIGDKLKIYLEFTDASNKRVPFEENNSIEFAKLQWEYYTENGFKKAEVSDSTFAFMRSGAVVLPIEEKMAEFDIIGRSNFCIKVTLLQQQYDFSPRLCNIFCNPVVFEQKQTMAKRLLFSYFPHGENNFLVRRSNVTEMTAMMLVLCTDGFWRMCSYETIAESNCILFSPVLSENIHPRTGENSLMIVIYKPEKASSLDLGALFGYDNQKISLPYGGAISKDFATLLVLQDSQGETVFADENNPSYAYACHLNRDGRELMVDSATFGEDNKLMAVSYSVTNGALGNIRQGELKNAICDKGIKVIANTNGSGGTDGATVAELKEKLATMLRNPAVPVTEEDYESFTRRIPGLCIDLVSAYCDGDNIVKIAVKPVSEEKFPHLGRVYKKAIEDYLEKVKLITTAIAVIEPVYLPIDVYLTVHTKPYAVNAEAIIKNALSQKLDYYKSGCGFGSILLYNGLYSCIEQLDCVEYIERLTVEADSSYKEAIVDGNDIRLGKSVLPYLRKSEIRQVLRV